MAENTLPPISLMDAKVNLDFCDPNIIHDRVLLVGEKKFYVVSAHLSQFSEYFVGLFNSNFKEKNEEIIELRDIYSSDFKDFLRALYPLTDQVTKNNLISRMKLSCRFICPLVWRQCLEYLKDFKEFTKFKATDLLEIAEHSNSIEMKVLIENHLIIIIKSGYWNDDGYKEALDICFKGKLKNLRDAFEKYLRDQSYSNGVGEWKQTLIMVDKFGFEVLKKDLDRRLCQIALDNPKYLMAAIKSIAVSNLPEIMQKVEKFFDQELEHYFKTKKFKPLEAETDYCIKGEVKYQIFLYLRKKVKKTDFSERSLDMYLELASQYSCVPLMVATSKTIPDDFAFKNGLKYLNLAFTNDLHGLKKSIAAYLKTVNLSELNEDDQKIVLSGSGEVKAFVISSLLGKWKE